MANNSEREASPLKRADTIALFIALLANCYRIRVMGRRKLFVSRVVSFPDGDFATAVHKIKQSGVELVVGSEAKDLLGKMEQVKGVVPQTDNIEEIWEVENWGEDEWTEQVLAEFAFCKAMNVQFFPDSDNRRGAGYRMRRAPNGLVLVPSDNDEDIFVAVRVETTKREARVLGWLRRSEGKVSQILEELPGHSPRGLARCVKTPRQGRLRAMPPFQELSP